MLEYSFEVVFVIPTLTERLKQARELLLVQPVQISDNSVEFVDHFLLLIGRNRPFPFRDIVTLDPTKWQPYDLLLVKRMPRAAPVVSTFCLRFGAEFGKNFQ